VEEVEVLSDAWITGYLVQVWVHAVTVVVTAFGYINFLTSELDLDS
jgi:hypothetical protein